MQGVLAKPSIVLHQLQALSCVALVFGRGVIVLTVFSADDSNDFSGFRFFCHGSLRCEARCGPNSLTIMPEAIGWMQLSREESSEQLGNFSGAHKFADFLSGTNGAEIDCMENL